MLQKLIIQNYAIIDELTVEFSSGLNIITGETGAGKSILIGALNLILGQRADSAVMIDKNRKSVVEGFFHIKSGEEMKLFFASNDLDADEEIILRREISASGKSRAFINDTPVNLSQLKSLAVMLVDLHQQFDTLELATEDFQRNVLDALAGNESLLRTYQERFRRYDATTKKLDQFSCQQAAFKKEQDYNNFLFAELDELSLEGNAIEDKEAALRLLTNAENVKQQLVAVSATLQDGQAPLVNELKSTVNILGGLAEFHPALQQLHDRLKSTAIELDDIASEIYVVNESIDYDAEKIETINDQLTAYYKLLKKHSVQTTVQLKEIYEQLQQKLDAAVSLDANIDSLQKEVTQAEKEVKELSRLLSGKRRAVIESFLSAVHALLKNVGMPGARLTIDITAGTASLHGADTISFLFDANKTGRFESLQKVASGGELSRLMLCIKSLVAKKLALPTLIFDEIDTGISGEAAKQVGIIMKTLSEEHQTIAITHQPQIAARASLHLFVYKQPNNGKIETVVIPLEKEERVLAIAKMLSGEKPTAAALENAREMVGG